MMVMTIMTKINNDNNKNNNGRNSKDSNKHFPAHDDDNTSRTSLVPDAACTATMLFCVKASTGCITISIRQDNKIQRQDTHIAPTQTTRKCDDTT